MKRLYLFCGMWCKNIKKYFEGANYKTLGPILLQKKSGVISLEFNKPESKNKGGGGRL